MAEKLGLPRPQNLPSTALGAAEATPLQVAAAYTAFANGGKLSESEAIKQVTNSDGGTVSEARNQKQQVLRPEIAWLMTSIMQDVLNRGTAARARQMGFTATGAGKTGTSRDGWFAGYTPNLVCVVWVGFDDNSELGLEGSKSALPIWASFMKQALQFRPDLGGSEFSKPDTITSAEIDPASGLIADESCPNHRIEYFVNGTEPQMTCSSKPGQPDEVPLKPETEPAEEPADPLDKMKKIMKDAVQERREERKQPPKPEENKPPNKPDNQKN